MELTFRQKVFLSKFLDDYHKGQGPVHYSAVAKRLGINNSSAYDMLRLLEKKRMVTSEYGIPKANSGPGRSNIYFAPTAEAEEIISQLAGDINEQDDWENVKARILTNLSNGKADNYQEVLDELLARMPEPRSPLVRCAEIMTALLVNLRGAKQELTKPSSLDNILKAPANKLRMSLLAGLVLGLSHANQRVRSLLGIYEGYAEKYEALLKELSRDNLLKLHQFTRDVWEILKISAR